jgi:hypothetical protein
VSGAAEFKPQVKFLCPWCKLEVMTGVVADDDSPLAFHEEPPCSKFEFLALDEYMHQARVYFEQNKPN